MNEQHKKQLFEEGYTTFNLYDLKDDEINSALDELYEMGKKEFKTLRYKKIQSSGGDTFIKDSFENLEIHKNSVRKYDLYEIWYYNDVLPKNKFNKVLLNKIKQFFYNEDVDVFNHTSSISMYNDDCVLIEHNDGFNPNSKYKCVILIYLNKEDEIKEGGELILNSNIRIKPLLGTIAILDFTKNDIRHGVSMVKDYQRKCFLNFC